jgi:hypothetical protein
VRVTIEIPAVISGTWETSGADRHDLVRVPTDFDIPEFSEADAPLAFEDRHRGNLVRIIDSKLYRAWPTHGTAREAFEEESSLHKAMFVGGLDFSSLSSIALDYIRDLKKENPFANVENSRRDLSATERNKGYDAPSITCLKAPLFRNWRWVASDTAERIEGWRGIAREFMGNFAIVDGCSYVRCFEPCYVLERVRDSARANIRQATTHVYAKEVHRRTTYGGGLEVMGDDALQSGTHFFSATDPQGALALADQLEWDIMSMEPAIEVHDPDAAQTDFLEMETARHAMMLMSACRRDLSSDPMVETLRQAILNWQDGRAGHAAMASAFHALRESELADVSERTSWLKQQMSAFLRREDGTPVQIRTMTLGPSA